MTNKGFFCFDGESFDRYATEQEARDAADAAIESRRDYAAEGWDEDTRLICWGRIVEEATITEQRERCPDPDCDGECGGDVHHSSDYDTEVDYGLRGVE